MGHLKNPYELVNVTALNFSTWYEKSYLSMYGYYILCGILKVPFEIPHKIPTHTLQDM